MMRPWLSAMKVDEVAAVASVFDQCEEVGGVVK